MRSTGSALRRLRRDAGLTQKQVANAVGLKSGGSVSAWELGKSGPKVNARKINRLAAVLHVHPWRIAKLVCERELQLVHDRQREVNAQLRGKA